MKNLTTIGAIIAILAAAFSYHQYTVNTFAFASNHDSLKQTVQMMASEYKMDAIDRAIWDLKKPYIGKTIPIHILQEIEKKEEIKKRENVRFQKLLGE